MTKTLSTILILLSVALVQGQTRARAQAHNGAESPHQESVTTNGTSPASSALLNAIKTFRCDDKQPHHELMKKAHVLLQSAMLVLAKGVSANEELLKESLRVVFCTKKYDQDLEGVEIIEPLVRMQEKAFDKVFKQFSSAEQESLNEDFDSLESTRENGNG